MICCYNLTGYSHKQTDDVINTTTNILREMSYHIVHMLSFHAGYNNYIDYQFIIPSSISECKIPAGQRTFSGQKYYLSGKIYVCTEKMSG